MRIIPLSAVLLSTWISCSAFANHIDAEPRPGNSAGPDKNRTVSAYIGGGWGFGGDEIGRFADSNGAIEKVRSGGGLLLEGGLLFPLDRGTRLRLTAGYQIDSASRINGDTAFERFRFDGTLLRGYGPHEFGIGITTHTSVAYNCNIDPICSGEVEFDSAVGYTLEYALRIGSVNSYRRRGRDTTTGVRLGLRYTGIEYQPQVSNSTVEDIKDGNSVVGFIGFSF
ncbi:hypothetical protein AB833_16820 [Chromatiales bacterium (ex Bugula neritina AB1)]|nr:hypothetical protein AB833_16820 [Chromatiales bacterium (ex Bugula neritina AB1)]